MSRTSTRLARSGIRWAVSVAAGTSAGRSLLDEVVKVSSARTLPVCHDGVEMRFVVPNTLSHFRIETFATKEPETLEWINGIPHGSLLWDIGANIGLYSCYAAKSRDCRVFAFEPSVFNLELLARNVLLNELTDQVTIIPLPLTDKRAFSKLNMTSTERGGALSTFGEDYGHDGESLHKMFEFPTLGLSMTDAVELLGVPKPQYVKIDVDGIEHVILRGGAAVLNQVASVLVEINDEFTEQARCAAAYLQEAGLTLVHKAHSQLVAESDFRGTFNQIWSRVATAPVGNNGRA